MQRKFVLASLCCGLAISGLHSAQAEEPVSQTRLSYDNSYEVTAGEEAAIERILEEIGERRIVALGEISHGDGSSFLFKARLIERLHRDHGFDVLAMEGSIYGHEAAALRIGAGEKTSEAFSRANFAIWTQAAEFAPLLRTLDIAAGMRRPFTLLGFDFQISDGYREETIARASSIADRLGNEGHTVKFVLERLAKLQDDQSEPDHDFHAAMAKLDLSRRTAIAAIKDGNWKGASSDAVFVDNLARFIRMSALYARSGFEGMGPEEYNVRDEMMAANLMWQAAELYPKRKFILWGATSHFLKTRKSIDTAIPMVPMGQHISNGPLSDDYYVLAFSAAGGRSTTFANGMRTLDPADPDGIEQFAMSSANQARTAFVSMPPCGKSTAKIRALGYQYFVGDWGCAIDGLVVFREMQPTSYPDMQ